MASAASSSFTPLLLLFLLTIVVESKPLAQRNNQQVLRSLFGSRLTSLILVPLVSDDVTGASVGHASLSFSREAALGRGVADGLVSEREAVPRFVLDVLQGQAKMRRRGRKSMVGGRGCFGMKMDRIGSISGLGC